MLKKTVLLAAVCALVGTTCSLVFARAFDERAPIDYDIVYVRAPRYGDSSNATLPEVATPLVPDPGANLMLLHPNGSEEVLFNAGANGAVVDPTVSFDGKSVVFAFYHDASDVNPQREVSYDGADVYRVDVATKQATRLTFQESSPNTGNGANFDCGLPFTNCPKVGVFNTGPAFLPDGRIVFTSTRENYLPNKAFSFGQRTMQLWVMNGDGSNQEPIGFLNVSAAMHPFVLSDGRIVFTSWENMGTRDDRAFALWSIWPDGSHFEPFSGFGDSHFAHHFMTQISNGSIVVCRYYNLNNNGFGELYSFPVNGTGAPNAPLFQPIPPDSAGGGAIPLQRVGYTRITPFTTGEDFPAPCRVGDPEYPVVPCPGGNTTRVGKFTQPSAAPANDLLVVYTRGAANHNGIYVGGGLATPFYDAGIYKMRGDQVLGDPTNLVLVKNDPNWNELWPRAVVPYATIHGTEPVVLPKSPNDGLVDVRLPEGTPLGLIGTSSMISRDTRPFRGDRFYRHENFGDRNWVQQGADAGLYTDADVYAVRLVALQPVTDRTYPNNGRSFASHFSERLRILGEIPVRKEGVVDAQGNVDTSFLVRVPADVPFTFQTLDRNGLVLNMAQTWHQVRPGEKRYDCGGCHAHSKQSLDFFSTVASTPGYTVRDMALETPLLSVDGTSAPGTNTIASPAVTYEYLRDIKPILQAKCASCHTSRNGATPAAGLDLDADDQLVDGVYPKTYSLLARQRSATNPTPRSITPDGGWWYPQMSRYIRAGQSRQSLLAWKIFGRRLDGRSNADRPTETVAGNPATIPGGVDFSECDLDFTGQAMPPPSSGITLTWDERMKIARWIDIGSPIDLTSIMQGQGGLTFAGFLEDDLRPTVSLVPAEAQAAAARRLTRLVVGAYDLESGIDQSSLSVTLDRTIGGVPAGTNLAAGQSIPNGGSLAINLPAPVDLATGNLTVTVVLRDMAGHTKRVARTYRPPRGGDTPGINVAASGAWFLHHANAGGTAELTFSFGPAGGGLVPLAGDWNGDVTSTPGLYNPATGAFFLKSTNASGAADLVFTFGPGGAGLVPLVGDWNGDGRETVGLYNPATGAYFLKNTNASGAADVVFSFGAGGGGLVPLAGDWNGDGIDTIGLYAPSTGAFFLKNTNAAGAADVVFSYGPANAVPLAGDWNADSTDTIGVYVPSSGAWFLRNANSPGVANVTYVYGPPGMTPLVGNWDGN